jgi:hypothetical protein
VAAHRQARRAQLQLHHQRPLLLHTLHLASLQLELTWVIDQSCICIRNYKRGERFVVDRYEFLLHFRQGSISSSGVLQGLQSSGIHNIQTPLVTSMRAKL